MQKSPLDGQCGCFPLLSTWTCWQVEVVVARKLVEFDPIGSGCNTFRCQSRSLPWPIFDPRPTFYQFFLKVIYGNFLLKPLGKILQWHLFLCYILPIVLQPESGVFETVPKGKRADIHLSKELSPHCTLDVNSNMRTVLYSENHKRHKEYRDKDE